MPGAVIRNHKDFDGKHQFLAEELIQPMSNRCDVGRTNMMCSHISQTVVLDAPERPRVFSRFENKFGEYTTAVRKAAQDAKIIGVFEKNPLQRIYALEYADGTAAIHFGLPAKHLTESYGYLLDNSPLDALMEGNVSPDGTTLPEGFTMQGWPCHDEHENFAFGINLRTVYMNLDGLTYEDGLVVSESAAERLSHTSIEKITVTLNANDLTLNLYGDVGAHRGFPDVGEPIRDGILLARRRINHESILFDLSSPQLAKINWDVDTPFFSEGVVMDVDVFSNLSETDLEKHDFNAQILSYERKAREFREWVDAMFGPYMRGEVGSGYSADVAYWHRRCTNVADRKWRYDKSEFDGVVLVFTIARRNKLNVGSKVTNRFGGKGVISEIRPDHEMPTTEGGERADLVVNSLGVINRLNSSRSIQ